MKLVNYTVIIPHKNIPSLLERCLTSIPVREDIQVIVIDDNSNDDTLLQLLELENRYRLVEFIYTECSKGAGYARNVGLARAQGRWLVFADADDYFADNFNEILDKYIGNNNEVIFFNYASVYSDTGEILDLRFFRKPKFDNLSNNRDYLEAYLRYEFGPPWSKFIKKSLIDEYNIIFDECVKHNDTMFSLKVGFYAHKIKMDSMILYYNTYRDNSITNAKIKNKRLYVDAMMQVALRYKDFSESKKIKGVKWRFFNVIWLIIRKDITLIASVFRFLFANNKILYFISYMPIYIIRIFLKIIFKPKGWLF
ncbi:MAG: glycosyltransferase family 2 protein [bacterium]